MVVLTCFELAFTIYSSFHSHFILTNKTLIIYSKDLMYPSTKMAACLTFTEKD